MLFEFGPLIYLSAFAAGLAGLLYPPLGLIVLAITGPLRPPSLPGPGFHLILVAAILVGCVFGSTISRDRLLVRPPLLLLVALIAYVFAQQLPDMVSGYAGERSHEVGFLFFQLATGLATIIAAAFVLRDRSPYPLLAALLISATFAAILGILAAGGGQYPLLENLLTPLEVGTRVTGPFGNPNAYSQLLAYAIALAAGLIASTHSLRVRAGLLLPVAIMGYAMTLSLSRGAIATMLAGLVVLAFARGRRIGIAALGVTLALVILGYPLFVEVRLATDAGSVSAAAAEELTSSDDSRLGAIMAGPAVFATSPVFGVGFGQYKFVSPLVTDEGAGLVAHNWYGTVLAEQGLLGIGLWLATLIAVRSWLLSRPERPRLIGLTMLGAAVVGSMFIALPLSFQTSVLPNMVITAALVAEWGGRAAAAADGRQAAPNVGQVRSMAALRR